MSICWRTIASAAVVMSGGAALCATAQAQTLLTAEAANPGSSSYIAMVSFGNVTRHHAGVELQVNAGATATRSMLDGARGDLDIYTITYTATNWMAEQSQMYEAIDDAPEAAENLRAIFSYPGGAYQMVVFEDSGIRSIEDFAGHSVFIGPAGGSAASQMAILIEGIAGLVADEDYDAVSLDWGGGQQAFQDGQVDVFIRPTFIGAANIEQFGLADEIRIIGIPDEMLDNEVVAELTDLPGRSIDSVPPGTYSNQTNEAPANALGFWLGVGASREVPDDTVYEMTRALWENLDEFQSAGAFLQAVTPENAFNHMNMPLHPGAYRYYQEQGYDVPEDLIPPEAM